MPAGQTTILPALPPPLRGAEPGSFAQDTLSRRLPGIARSLLDQVRSQAARINLQALADDMPAGRLRPIQDAGAPDLANWHADLQPYLGQTWLEAPWFVAEVYFFRRILEATGYFQPGVGQGADPYHAQKDKGLAGVASQLGQTLAHLPPPGAQPLPPDTLARLIHTVVWGNQADLSVWPIGGVQPSTLAEGQSPARLLVNHAPAAAELILRQPNGLNLADFILDNIGLELAYDLLLADFLLGHGLAQRVRLHAKPFPTYVSDAAIPDVLALVDHLSQAAEPALREMGNRLQRNLHERRLLLKSSYFWTSPLPAWEMPADLRNDLAGADLLISKGDANYRRLLGDRHWPVTDPLERIIAYRPAPLLLLRVMKSEIVAGLQPRQAEQLSQADPSWMFNGRSGLVQFVP